MIPEAMHLGFIFLWTTWNKALQSVVGDVVDGSLGFQTLLNTG